MLRADSPVSEPAGLDTETLASIERILEMADLHRKIGRLAEPPGSNAYEAYQAVMQMQPGNTRAREGMDEITNHYLQTARKEFAQGNLKAALSDVEYGLKLFPDNHRLLRLKNLIAERMGG